MEEKEVRFAGADESTPSIPQYFSWINSTNEGSTEAQTLINLDYFRYMRDTYGMEIKIYAWDAGNFDGASMGFGDTNSDKFRSQYPNGYGKIVEKAAESGIRMGLWGSPDGFGDDPETERKRFDFFVHLCRDYHFMEFKLDGVCGALRPEKASVFAAMIAECRKYSPDLIVLNHRLNLYEATKYATTFLWEGRESYTDSCCMPPQNTAMHNRSYLFHRGLVPGMARLCEDHGVCISSSIDYFEDEMIYQAFSRSLILAPETYGNPWFLKDSEQPRFARIYNLHKRNAGILVNGMALSETLGAHPVSRGSGKKRFLCTGNNSWEEKTITVTVDSSIGITEKGRYEINLRHPYDEQLAVVGYGETFTYTLMPFRAALIEIAAPDVADPILPGFAYSVIREDADGHPLEYRVLRDNAVDLRERAPRFLGSFDRVEERGADDEFLYETAMFAVSNDAMEAQSLVRAGKTSVPEIRAARDAFFAQETYRLRGCENKNLFDGKEDTLFDAQSRSYCGKNLRIDGGCLRVDLGGIVDADTVEIISFDANEATREVPPLLTPEYGTYSCDLREWKQSGKARSVSLGPYTQRVAQFTKHTIYDCEGRKVRTVYPVGPLRYFRLPEPMDRIYSFRVYKNGIEQSLPKPFANNMMAPYEKRPSKFVKKLTVTLPAYRSGSYLAIAIEGEHGAEGAYCVAEADGRFFGADRRSSSYCVNNWEHRVLSIGKNYTYFITLPDGLGGKEVTLTVLSNGTMDPGTVCNAYLCDRHD